MRKYTISRFGNRLLLVENAIINCIEVLRDYKVKIDFNFDFEQFTQGLDIAA